MLATDAKRLPEGEAWAFEVKWDGIRALVAHQPGAGMRILSRRGEQITDRYPELSDIGEALDAREAILDAEIVALDDSGRPSFQRLQRRMGVTAPLTIRRRVAETPVTLIAFDLLSLDGKQTVDLPL